MAYGSDPFFFRKSYSSSLSLFFSIARTSSVDRCAANGWLRGPATQVPSIRCITHNRQSFSLPRRTVRHCPWNPRRSSAVYLLCLTAPRLQTATRANLECPVPRKPRTERRKPCTFVVVLSLRHASSSLLAFVGAASHAQSAETERMTPLLLAVNDAPVPFRASDGPHASRLRVGIDQLLQRRCRHPEARSSWRWRCS